MKKSGLFFVIFSFLVFSVVGVSHGWQGRMGGMGDPYGLISDESDFLIHPSGIVKGEGVKFYGNYGFTYTGVTDWSYDLDLFLPTGTLISFSHYDTSGREYKHNALLGATFPLWQGRMGLFFEYDALRGDYGGNEDITLMSNFTEYDLTKDLDHFALRLLYGLPIGGFNLGGEVQLAYRQEENENSFPGLLNSITNDPWFNLTPFQLPYDSKYWEALFKGSLEGKVGLLDLGFILRGGFIFGGDNSLVMGTPSAFFDSSGDVEGWRIGGDLWARYPLTDGLSLPFLVRGDFQEKTRDGEGPGQGAYSLYNWPYESQEKSLHLEAGGGVDKEFGKSSRIAAGIYYNYLQGEYDITLNAIGPTGFIFDHSDYPASIEHQVMIRLVGELEASPLVTLRMGLAPFYGWVREDFTFTYGNPNPAWTNDISLDGYHWGIGASLGGTIKFNSITLEPFVNGGWQQIKLNGDGETTQLPSGAISYLWEMDKLRKEWSIGGGLSIKFN